MLTTVRVFMRALSAAFQRRCFRFLLVATLGAGLSPDTAWGVISGEDSTSRVKVRAPAFAADRLVKAGATFIADYGAFQLFDLPANSPALAADPSLEVQEEADLVSLHAGPINTASPQAKAARTALGNFQGKRTHLVQFAGPVKPEWRQELLDAGVQIVSYIPHNAYLVYGDAQSIARLQVRASISPHFQWEGAYGPEHKVHPSARPNAKATQNNAWEITNAVYAVQLIADPETNPATFDLIDRLKLEPVRRQEAILDYINLVVAVPPDSLDEIAARPDVVSIQPYAERKKFCERQAQIMAGNLLGTTPSGPGYLEWLQSKGFTQAQFLVSGFIVDLSDSGIDDGNSSPNHFGLYPLGNMSNASRIAYNRLVGTPNRNSTLAGCDGHGTLNAHIIGGYSALADFPYTDTAGYHYGLGLCPYVKIGSSVVFDPDTFTSPNFRDLQSRAYNSGARISNNSWGGDPTGSYDIDAQTFDALVRDAQPTGAAVPLPGNQQMVIVVAAGNDGPSASTVGSPGSAKNVITVGAGEGVQAIGGTDSSGISDSQANNATDMASFSSRGPCSDSRHKPDLVAPGTHISGGVYQSTTPGTTGKAASCFTGSGVSGGVGSKYFPSGQQFYTASSGTSHSAPAVSGVAALLRQYFINHSIAPPSPAMTKAYLMSSTRYMTGASANDDLWSDRQGMGRLDLGTALDDEARVLRDQLPADLFTASGQSRTFTGNIVNTNKPFRVTLAWTDAPGTTAGAAYNNDLDLVVTVNGKIYRGNSFVKQWSTTSQTADSKNNVESVILPPGATGTYTVQVIAANINSDGVPQNQYPLDQDFALVIYNAELEKKPVLSPGGETLVGESFPPNGAFDPGETVTVNFAMQNIGTANTTNLVASLVPSGGVSSPSPEQVYGTVVPGDAPISRPFTFVVNGNCADTVTATLRLRDGPSDLGTVAYQLTLGKFVTSVVYEQTFDFVPAPEMASGWTTSSSGQLAPWVNSSSISDSPPNSMRVEEPTTPGVSELDSPPILINSTAARLSFRNRYDIEADDQDATLCYDGGVLEIKIDSGPWADLLNAGGSFISGGYTRTVDSTTDSAFAGKRVWGGNSGGFITTEAALPASAAGHMVQFRWRFATDSGNFYGGTGWNIDSVSVQDGAYTCPFGVPPTLHEVNATPDGVTFSFLTTAGQTYVVESTDNPASGPWAAGQMIAGTGAEVTVTNAVTGPQQFFRVRVSP